MPIFVIETLERAEYFPTQTGDRANVYVVVAEDQSAAVRLVDEKGNGETRIQQIVGEIEDEGERIVETFGYCV